MFIYFDINKKSSIKKHCIYHIYFRFCHTGNTVCFRQKNHLFVKAVSEIMAAYSKCEEEYRVL